MRENGGKNESYRIHIKCWKYSRIFTILGNELNHPVYSFKQAKNEVSCGSEIIYLGWIMAKEIKEYKRAAKLYKVCAVCGVGM